jgi:hypothetical protein
MAAFKEEVEEWYTIVDNGNTVVDKWKGHSITDKLQVASVKTKEPDRQ